MTLMIIRCCACRTLFSPFQFVLGVDEEAAEGDDLLAGLQAAENDCRIAELRAGLNCARFQIAASVIDKYNGANPV